MTRDRITDMARMTAAAALGLIDLDEHVVDCPACGAPEIHVELIEQRRSIADVARVYEITEAQALAARHVAWLRGIPGTPAATPGGDVAGYVRGLGELYVADPRFAANYGGQAGAEFVRAALAAYADAHL